METEHDKPRATGGAWDGLKSAAVCFAFGITLRFAPPKLELDPKGLLSATAIYIGALLLLLATWIAAAAMFRRLRGATPKPEAPPSVARSVLQLVLFAGILGGCVAALLHDDAGDGMKPALIGSAFVAAIGVLGALEEGSKLRIARRERREAGE